MHAKRLGLSEVECIGAIDSASSLPRCYPGAVLALSWRCPGSKLSHPAHTLQQPPPLSCLAAECPHRSTQLVILE